MFNWLKGSKRKCIDCVYCDCNSPFYCSRNTRKPTKIHPLTGDEIEGQDTPSYSCSEERKTLFLGCSRFGKYFKDKNKFS